MDAIPRTEERLLGMIERKYRWRLSLRAKLLLALILMAAAAGALLGIYPFLAITTPVDAHVLVVEGWVHPYAMEAASKEFKARKYAQVYTTGGPVVGKGGYINDWNTVASVGAELLVKAGVPRSKVRMVPCRVSGRDRTYSSALALRDWLDDNGVAPESLNVMTEGAHARRTRLMFQAALGDRVKVGIISVRSPDFDARHWWYYSEGTETIIDETIGYLYAKFLFSPEQPNARRRRQH